MQVADIIATISLVVSIGGSIGGAIYSRRIEKRLQARADRLATFDNWIALPLEGPLNNLSISLAALCTAARLNSADRAARQAAVARVQNSDFIGAVEEVSGYCEARSDDVAGEANERLNVLVDEVLDAINELGEEIEAARVLELSRSITVAKQRFLSDVRADVQAARLAQK